MKKRILAICDLEALYACNFMQYISQKKSVPFEIQAFTNTEKLIEAAKKERIEVLLISDKAMDERIRQLSVGQIIILSEGVHDPKLDQYPSIYKYQSSESVIREVMACYGEAVQEPMEAASLKRPVEIYGVYSPLGRVLKTSFALSMGQILAKKKAVLYLNLEEYAGFEQLLEQNFDRNLSDLIYYMKQRQRNLTHRISQMVQSVNNMDYIPPAVSPADIRNTQYQDWDFLLDELELRSSYEVIILDVGDGVDELYQILGRCNRIFMPVLDDSVSKAKIQQFENLLRLWDAVSVLEKIEKVRPPFHKCTGSGIQYMEQLVWSQLGDYVRDILRKDRT